MRSLSSIKKKKFKVVTEEERPKSAITKYPYISSNQISKINLSMPNNPKLSKGMGQKIEKEKLFEDNVFLRKMINNLSKELFETKNEIFKKNEEIKEKNFIIENLSKEEKKDLFENENIINNKNSSLLNLCKDKFLEMKNDYLEKCNENNFLKQNMKITKIKENQIENEILKKELNKLKNLYFNSIKTIENDNKEINNLKEYKNRFNEQKILLNSINEKYEKLNQENYDLKEKINECERKIENNNLLKRKLNFQNEILKNTNEQFLNEKRENKNNNLNNNHYERISFLKKEIGEYKNLIRQSDFEIKRLKDKEIKLLLEQNNKFEPMLKVKNLNFESLDKLNNKDHKISLTKSLLHDYQIKIIIYEKFLVNNDKDINLILKNGGFYQNNNTSNSSNQNNNDKNFNETNQSDNLKNTNNNENINNNNNNNNYETTGLNTENSNNINSNNINNNNNNNNNINTNNNINENDKIEEENLNDLEIEDENTFSHIIMKNLEGNHVTSEFLENQFNDIIQNNFKDQEISAEDFIKPFHQLLIKDMKVSNNKDIEILNLFLENLLEKHNNDADYFLKILHEIFTSVFDYSSINKKEMNEKLKNELKKYPNLIDKFKEKDINSNYIITYYDFKNIHSELNLNFEDSIIEYFIYIMKINVNENGNSIIDLNYKIIENLLNEDFEKNKIKDQEFNYEEINKIKNQNIEIGNKIKKLNENLKVNNLNFDDVVKGKIENIEFDDNIKRGIKKEDFIQILKDNDIDIDNNDEKNIFNKYKLDDKFNDSQNLLDVTLIQNSMINEETN